MNRNTIAENVNEFFRDQRSLQFLSRQAEEHNNLSLEKQQEARAILARWNENAMFYRSVRRELEILRPYLVRAGRHCVPIVANIEPAPRTRANIPKNHHERDGNEGSRRLEKDTLGNSSKKVIYLPVRGNSKNSNPKLSREQQRTEFSSPQAKAEYQRILSEEKKFEMALEDIVSNHFDQTIDFSKGCSIQLIAEYLKGLFGKELYFDSLLSIIQQYALANVPIINEPGKIIGRTGFNLSFFGDPGTGKTFAIKDMILGNPDAGIPAHGLIGKNRYCGSITAARFVRMAEAYRNHTFNFIVPEFDDWFRYKGMVNTLKAAMEGSPVEYETNNETIGPYQFKSFFSVNYNTKVSAQDYQATIGDSHFKAIEDRMLNNLHRMTKDRYDALAHSREKLEQGTLEMSLAQPLQRQVMLLYAIQTSHPLVAEHFPALPIMATAEFYEQLEQARAKVLQRGENGDSLIQFSPRLERRALQLAAAATLPGYFRHCSANRNPEFLPLDPAAIDYATTFFVREATFRSRKNGNEIMNLPESP